jgi:hypothetical protein
MLQLLQQKMAESLDSAQTAMKSASLYSFNVVLFYNMALKHTSQPTN